MKLRAAARVSALMIASMGALLLSPACKGSGPEPAQERACAEALKKAGLAWGVVTAGLDKEIEANTLDPERARLSADLKALGEKVRADIQDPETRKVEEEKAAAVEEVNKNREAYVAALKDLRASAERMKGAYGEGFEAALAGVTAEDTGEKNKAVDRAGAAYEASLKRTSKHPGLVAAIPPFELRTALGGTTTPEVAAATACMKIEIEKAGK